MKRSTILAIVAVGVLNAAIVGFAIMRLLPKDASPIPIGRDTTYLLGPVDAAGEVDYRAALDEHFGRGVTPQNNALVGLWQAWGPLGCGDTPPDGYFAALGMPPPPVAGDYLKPIGEAIEAAANGDADLAKRLNADFDAAADAPWPADKYPEIAAWIARNQAPLGRAVEAVKKRRYFQPTAERSERGRYMLSTAIAPRELGAARELARLLLCRAHLRMGAGEHAAAGDDLLACRRFARLVAQAPSYMSANLAFTLDAIAAFGERNLLRSPGMNAAEARRYLDEFSALELQASPLDSCDRAARYCFLDSMLRLREQNADELSKAYLLKDPARVARIDFEEIMREGNRTFDRLAAACRLTSRDARKAELLRIEKDFQRLGERFIERERSVMRGGTSGGSIVDRITDGEFREYCLSRMLWTNWQWSFERLDGVEQDRELTLVAAALASYRVEHGRYPTRLAELSPTYLKSVPLDRFSGAELIYRTEPDGCLLYGVGPNGSDDGGRNDVYGVNSDLDDAVIRMSGAKAK